MHQGNWLTVLPSAFERSPRRRLYKARPTPSPSRTIWNSGLQVKVRYSQGVLGREQYGNTQFRFASFAVRVFGSGIKHLPVPTIDVMKSTSQTGLPALREASFLHC